MLVELIWQYRFLYRNRNDLRSRNRRLETHFQFVLENKGQGVQKMLSGLGSGGAVRIALRDVEPESAGRALLRGALHVPSLFAPYLETSQCEHLHAPAGSYQHP